MSKLTVTYIKHSGFLVETANNYLLFDYWQGKLPELRESVCVIRLPFQNWQKPQG